MFFGFTSLIYMIIVTRFVGIEEAGKFTFAYAVACTFYIVGVYYGKSFQITDTSNRYYDTDYINNRLTTCIIMVILTLLFCFIMNYSMDKILLILALTIYRGTDAFIDSLHAIIQKKDRVYKVGVSIFLRALLLIIAFIISVVLFKNIIVSSIIIMIINILYLLLIDFKLVKKSMTKGKFDKTKNIILLIEGFSVFLFSFLAIYVINSSKYAIDALSTNEIQGVFGIIFLPSSFVSLISLYIVQPFLNNIAMFIKEKRIKKLNSLLIKLTLLISLVGLFAIIIALFMGIPVLELLYGIKLNNQLFNLIIIIIGSLFYSIYSIYSQVLIAMRKNLYQVVSLIILFFMSILLSNYLVQNNGINGASMAYLLIMLIELLFILGGYLFYSKRIVNSNPKLTIRLMGGLGNQMFQYAVLRNMQLNNKCEAVIDLVGITNKNHNVYGLNNLNISNDIKITDNTRSLKGFITYLLYGFYWVFLSKSKKGLVFMNYIESYLNSIGIYLVVDGYIELDNIKVNDNYMVGYFQSEKYFKDNIETIKQELQVNINLSDKNTLIQKEMLTNNSVCIHIRRGDYVGSTLEVCTKDYYYDAIKEMNKRVKNPKYYVFSDDIKWVKENMKFDNNTTIIDWKNNQYEDLKLMSNCKNFIMSNSTFSFWAQFLSLNKNKIVIAPSKWYNNDKKVDIYDENWIIIDIK